MVDNGEIIINDKQLITVDRILCASVSYLPFNINY